MQDNLFLLINNGVYLRYTAFLRKICIKMVEIKDLK